MLDMADLADPAPAFAAQRFTRPTPPRFTVFCDFDGPIVDVSDRYYNTYCLGLAGVQAAYREAGTDLPIHQLSKAQFWQMKQERTPDPEVAMRSGLPEEAIGLFLQQVQYWVNQPNLLHQDQLQPGVRWALSMLHEQGARLILVTLRRQAQAAQMLQDYGLMPLFSGVWGATDDCAAYANQATHKAQLLASVAAKCRLGCAAAGETTSAWMIGDTEADILAGQACGIPTIALTCGIRSRAYLQKFAPTQIQANLLSAARYLTQNHINCSRQLA